MRLSNRRLGLLSGCLIAMAATTWLVPRQAQATFHLWDVAEVYSNADGSVQFVELFTSSSNQQFLNSHTLTVSVGGTSFNTFTFGSNSSSPTSNHRLLLATPAYAALAGVPAPDYELPLDGDCGCFFPITGDGAVMLSFNFGEGSDVVSFQRSAVPTDGFQSLERGGGTTMTAQTSSPTNFGGDTCILSCPDSGACTSANGGCIECLVAGDCEDSDVCTDDACTDGACVNANNTASCDDGQFCTATDICSGGECVGSGDSCLAQLCNETTNACVECLVAADCGDSLFCNGAELCQTGTCTAGVDPCPDDLCDDDLDVCVECLDAGDCDDSNVCTDDSCNGSGVCVHAPNTDSCDDGLFCTNIDTCSAGSCVGSGSPCDDGQNCSEGTDVCANCVAPADCEDGDPCTVESCTSGACGSVDATDNTLCLDGDFCNGAESCQSGICTAPGDPCDAVLERCVEAEDVCELRCGDGLLDAIEDCDDGNADDGDGCSLDCEVEAGWDCPAESGPPTVCTATCGDGVFALGAEDCDDGGQDDGDGCDATCQIEAGWLCAPESDDGPDVCEPVLGDGLVEGTEECDDGNDEADDGCFEGTLEAGFACDDNEPTVCELEHGHDDVGAPDAGDAGDAGEGDSGGSSAGEDSGGCRTVSGRQVPDAALWLAVLGLGLARRRTREQTRRQRE